MGKIRPGNKQNSALNGEWAAHVKKGFKKITSGLRRAKIKKDNTEQIDEEREVGYEDLKPNKEYMKVKKKLNAIEMLEKLQFSNNVVISNMAKRILNNESTISQEWDKNPGSFVKSVLIGDYAIAISLADLDNKKVLEKL